MPNKMFCQVHFMSFTLLHSSTMCLIILMKWNWCAIWYKSNALVMLMNQRVKAMIWWSNKECEAFILLQICTRVFITTESLFVFFRKKKTLRLQIFFTCPGQRILLEMALLLMQERAGREAICNYHGRTKCSALVVLCEYCICVFYCYTL